MYTEVHYPAKCLRLTVFVELTVSVEVFSGRSATWQCIIHLNLCILFSAIHTVVLCLPFWFIKNRVSFRSLISWILSGDQKLAAIYWDTSIRMDRIPWLSTKLQN